MAPERQNQDETVCPYLIAKRKEGNSDYVPHKAPCRSQGQPCSYQSTRLLRILGRLAQ